MQQATIDNKTMRKNRIFIVDDHPVVRRGLTHLINQQDDLEVCGEAETAHEAFTAIECSKPDIAIIDISLKDSNGIELIRKIRATNSGFLILVLSMHDESVYAELVLQEGAMGYIMKLEAIDKILIALRRILNGEIYVSDKMASKMLYNAINGRKSHYNAPFDSLSNLSKREQQVFRLIGLGYRTQQIADELSLGIKTIETHRAHIKKKLKLTQNSELTKFSIKWMQSQTFY